jgi:hypothetical protein
MLKIFSTEKIFQSHAFPTGTLVCEDKQILKVALHDGFLLLKKYNCRVKNVSLLKQVQVNMVLRPQPSLLAWVWSVWCTWVLKM